MSNTADGPSATDRPQPIADPAGIEVVAPNFKRRLSGVTSTLLRVLPVQARTLRIATIGVPLPIATPRVPWLGIAALWRRPAARPFRIWHARRNNEMVVGVILRDLLRMRLRLVFTSAAQRHHTWSTRFLIGRMDAVIAPSRRSASYLKRSATVIPHGIDLDAFRPAASQAAARARVGLEQGPLIGCFGRIRPTKGTDVFVDAMIRVLPLFPEATAVLLGRATGAHATFLDDLKRRVAAAGLSERIRFMGEVMPADAVSNWYPALDVFVASSRVEGFGLTPLEAGACGIPVVATTAGAFPEIIADGVTGMLVPVDDAPALAAAVQLLLANPENARRMGAAARDHVGREFSLDREAQAINAVYAGLWERADKSVRA